MSHWSCDAIFYHIYPLGLTGAPERNDFSQPPVARLEQLYDWMPHLKALGVNALYLGPLFKSAARMAMTRSIIITWIAGWAATRRWQS